jgi:hypothetical protein
MFKELAASEASSLLNVNEDVPNRRFLLQNRTEGLLEGRGLFFFIQKSKFFTEAFSKYGVP